MHAMLTKIRMTSLHFVGRVAAVLLLLGLSSTLHADLFGRSSKLASEPTFLPVNEAFVFSSYVDDGELTLMWQMPAGYYLYRHRLQVPGVDAATLPRGLAKTDEIFGDVEVFYDECETISHAIGRTPDNESCIC